VHRIGMRYMYITGDGVLIIMARTGEEPPSLPFDQPT
jgi:hypothetical protein